MSIYLVLTKIKINHDILRCSWSCRPQCSLWLSIGPWPDYLSALLHSPRRVPPSNFYRAMTSTIWMTRRWMHIHFKAQPWLKVPDNSDQCLYSVWQRLPAFRQGRRFDSDWNRFCSLIYPLLALSSFSDRRRYHTCYVQRPGSNVSELNPEQSKAWIASAGPIIYASANICANKAKSFPTSVLSRLF